MYFTPHTTTTRKKLEEKNIFPVVGFVSARCGAHNIGKHSFR